MTCKKAQIINDKLMIEKVEAELLGDGCCFHKLEDRVFEIIDLDSGFVVATYKGNELVCKTLYKVDTKLKRILPKFRKSEIYLEWLNTIKKY